MCFETSVSIVGHGWKRYVTIFYTYCYTNKKVQHDKHMNLHASKILLCNHKMYTNTHEYNNNTLQDDANLPFRWQSILESADYVT